MPRIFVLDNGLFKECMQFSDVKSVGRKDFEEFGGRIGLPKRLVNRELDYFCVKYPAVKTLVDNSFLSEKQKSIYWRATDYRRKMLTMS